MDCVPTYNLDPDYIFGSESICLTENGFSKMIAPDECGTGALHYPHGTEIVIKNFDSIDRTVESLDGTIPPTVIAPGDSIQYPEPGGEWWPIGVTTLSSERDNVAQTAGLTIYHPGALDMNQSTDGFKGCCRAAIQVEGRMIYSAFPDFANNPFPQYLRLVGRTVYFDVTPTYPINGSMATVGGGVIESTTRLRAPHCLWSSNNGGTSINRGIYGREETVYTPDNQFHLFFINAPIVTDSPRIEVDPGPGAPGPRELHYYIEQGDLIQIDDQTTYTPLYWKYQIISDHPEDDGSAACGFDACDGGLAGYIEGSYEVPYSAVMLKDFLRFLVIGDDELRWQDCEYPYTKLRSVYPSIEEVPEGVCSGESGAGLENVYADFGPWPLNGDSDWSLPGPNQVDVADQRPPLYDCITFDNETALQPDPAYAYPANITTTRVQPILSGSTSIHERGTINHPAHITIKRTDDPSPTFIIEYAATIRWWSAPYQFQVKDYFIPDWVNDPATMTETLVQGDTDTEGNPDIVAPCHRIDDPNTIEDFSTLLGRKMEELLPNEGFSRVLTFECPPS